LEAQPPSTIPNSPIELIPTTNKIPTLISRATWNDGPNASAAIENIAADTEITGAIQKMNLSAISGMMSSLISSFTASAIGCSNPCGPTRIGPSRACMSAISLRSTSTT